MKIQNNRIAILLTASIAPNGMPYTALQNPSIRLSQYIAAVKFYLQKTNVLIVFVENTNTYSKEISIFQDKYKSRFEYLTFNGNNFNKELGKGYGEALIIKYALENSILLKHTDYIIKITGRIIIPNIYFYTHSYFLKNILRVDLGSYKYVYSMCFISSKKWYIDYFLPSAMSVNENHGYFLEHLLYDLLVKTRKHIILPFTKPLKYQGISGTTNKPYFIKHPRTHLEDNISLLSILHKEKKNIIISYILKLFLFIIITYHYCVNKIYKK